MDLTHLIKKRCCIKCKEYKYVTEFDYNIFNKEYSKKCKKCLQDEKNAK